MVHRRCCMYRRRPPQLQRAPPSAPFPTEEPLAPRTLSACAEGLTRLYPFLEVVS